MITLLRKIRKRLIKEGQFSNYLLYAVGEIALVVIGILIALQINNWNEQRQQQNKINIYLENLVNDLKDDIRRVGHMQHRNMFRVYSMQYLLEMADVPPFDYAKDGMEVPQWQNDNPLWKKEIPLQYDSSFINLAFLWTHRMSRAQVNTSTIDELKSLGLYSYIDNEDLKKAIADYYDLASFRLGTREAFQPLVEDWHQSLLKEGITNADPYIYEDPIALIRTDKYRSGTLRRLIRQAAWMVEGADEMKPEADALIELIQKEIE